MPKQLDGRAADFATSINTLVTKGHFESGLVTVKVCDLAI